MTNPPATSQLRSAPTGELLWEEMGGEPGASVLNLRYPGFVRPIRDAVVFPRNADGSIGFPIHIKDGEIEAAYSNRGRGFLEMLGLVTGFLSVRDLRP